MGIEHDPPMKPFWTGYVAASCTALAWLSPANAQEKTGGSNVGQSDNGDFSANLGLQVGLRVAYTDGLGVVDQGVNLSDASSGALPILIDVGWRFLPELYVGLYGQYAPVFLKTYEVTCPSGLSCSAQDWRFGVEADYHFPAVLRPELDPYVGLGAGYEILQSSFHGPHTFLVGTMLVPGVIDASFTDRGWEYASLTLGLDWRFGHMLGAGLFLTGSVGQFDTQTGTFVITTSSGPQNQPVAGIPACGPGQSSLCNVHTLAAIGVRGSFNL
jgi:hypothetical protein